MGNPLKKIEPWIDPIGNQGQKAIANVTGLGADPKNPNAGLTPYNPNNAPGSHLTPAPAGGPPTGSGIFGPDAGNAPPGYAPNPWQMARGGSMATPPPGGPSQGPGGPSQGPGGPSQAPGGPGNPGGIWLGRGGSSGVAGQPPAMSTGGQGMPPSGPQNPQLQQQMAIAQMLRNPQGQPPARSIAM